MPRPQTCVDVASLLLDYYELSPDVVFSPDLNLQELLILGINKQSWLGYMNALSQKQAEKNAQK